ncbi:hypothetical protein LCGC14_0879520 [marine sediment metagenome]|uniref:Uncharacterized protein n=1 Tax=marine sediment metagenome TaxID=412755 RepID=A0A0F9P2C6_9ZZZZ
MGYGFIRETEAEAKEMAAAIYAIDGTRAKVTWENLEIAWGIRVDDADQPSPQTCDALLAIEEKYNAAIDVLQAAADESPDVALYQIRDIPEERVL